MKQYTKYLSLLFVALINILLVASCSKNETPAPEDTFKLTGVSIPGTISVALNTDLSIIGKGFSVGDN